MKKKSSVKMNTVICRVLVSIMRVVFCEYYPKRFPIIIFFLSVVNILAYNKRAFISLFKVNKVIITIKYSYHKSLQSN